jgi:hypothetical protein
MGGRAMMTVRLKILKAAVLMARERPPMAPDVPDSRSPL